MMPKTHPSPKSKAGVNVRLPRTSSAIGVYHQQRRDTHRRDEIWRRDETGQIKENRRVDDIVDTESVTDTVTGKLPVEAAFIVMKRVTKETGRAVNPVGLSTYNKLQSLKTTPAVDLLLQKTWREFFRKKNQLHSGGLIDESGGGVGVGVGVG
ncbi:hypothetical protein B484DRAFT_418559, partial [Ochromonadaceae sp. CCMP2298]